MKCSAFNYGKKEYCQNKAIRKLTCASCNVKDSPRCSGHMLVDSKYHGMRDNLLALGLWSSEQL